MALLLLNCSVDTSGLFSEPMATNSVSNNEQESIIEIVVEQFLGFESAIPEYGDCNETDQEAIIKKAQAVDIFILPNFKLESYALVNVLRKYKLSDRKKHLQKIHFEIPSPPPEV